MSPGRLERKAVFIVPPCGYTTVTGPCGQHPGLTFSRSCTYLFLATDKGELSLKEYHPLDHNGVVEYWLQRCVQPSLLPIQLKEANAILLAAR